MALCAAHCAGMAANDLVMQRVRRTGVGVLQPGQGLDALCGMTASLATGGALTTTLAAVPFDWPVLHKVVYLLCVLLLNQAPAHAEQAFPLCRPASRLLPSASFRCCQLRTQADTTHLPSWAAVAKGRSGGGVRCRRPPHIIAGMAGRLERPQRSRLPTPCWPRCLSQHAASWALASRPHSLSWRRASTLLRQWSYAMRWGRSLGWSCRRQQCSTTRPQRRWLPS